MNNTSKRIQYTLSDGTCTFFNRQNLKHAIRNAIAASSQHKSQQAFLEELADSTGNSFSAIKHWLAGHNAPSDIEKLQAIADFLNVELTDLLETEMENTSMTNTAVPIKAVDFSETKNTLRDLYIRMADYIEHFRSISVNYTGSEPLAAEFPALYSAIMHTRLDVPKELFTSLSSFAVNYLQQMFCYVSFIETVEDENSFFPESIDTEEAFIEAYTNAYSVPGICPWFEKLCVSIDEDSKDCQLFVESIKQQFRCDDDYSLFVVSNEIITETAYTRLEDILKDYLFH